MARARAWGLGLGLGPMAIGLGLVLGLTIMYVLMYIQVQYVFIFDALKEYIICGETEVQALKLRERIEKMTETGETELTGFEQEYRVRMHVQIINFNYVRNYFCAAFEPHDIRGS